MQSPIPPSSSSPLQVYQAQDGSVWALNPASGRGLQLVGPQGYEPPATGPAGIPDAPSDGTVYGRENAGWVQAVAKAGDTMNGNLIMNQAQIELEANGPTAVLYLRNDTGFGGLVVSASPIEGSGNAVQLVPGSTPQIAILSGGSVTILTGKIIWGLSGVQTELQFNQPTGDLIAVADAGPNAGKSINLTNGFVAPALPPVVALSHLGPVRIGGTFGPDGRTAGQVYTFGITDPIPYPEWTDHIYMVPMAVYFYPLNTTLTAVIPIGAKWTAYLQQANAAPVPITASTDVSALTFGGYNPSTALATCVMAPILASAQGIMTKRIAANGDTASWGVSFDVTPTNAGSASGIGIAIVMAIVEIS